MKILKWGFIGCGEVTEKKSGPAFSEVPGSTVEAVMSRSEKNARRYAEKHGIGKWYTDAQEIIDDATIEANELKTSAMQYTDSLLSQVEEIVGTYMGTTNTKYDEMMKSLHECYDVVRANRQELIETAVDDSGVDVEDILSDNTPAISTMPPMSSSSDKGQSGKAGQVDLDLI